MAIRDRSLDAWNLLIWVGQIILAAIFFMAGGAKITMPIADLAAQMVWPGDVPAFLVRFIGYFEVAGALGLILPAATRIFPVLTPLAGAGLMVVMTLASLFHVARMEYSALPLTLGLFALATFVAWGRFVKVPITDRSSDPNLSERGVGV